MRSSGSTIVLGVAFAWVATAVPMGPISAADSATVVPLLDELAAAGPLAVSANGQTAYVVDESRRVIVGFDPFDPARRRDAIGPAADTEPVPIAVAGLPGDLLAVVGRAGDRGECQNFVARRNFDELAHIVIGRVQHHFLRRCQLHQLAVFHDADAISQSNRLIKIVGNEQNSFT